MAMFWILIGSTIVALLVVLGISFLADSANKRDGFD
jgi:hypothetical protein